MRTYFETGVVVFFLLIIFSCCKEKKKECYSSNQIVAPFAEYKGDFYCNNNVEYNYIFKRKSQIDSLMPDCFITGTVAFPVDDNEVTYFVFGKLSSYQKDTFETQLLKDTCLKTLVYKINMVQRDSNLRSVPGVLDILCEAQNIPSDYQVTVEYHHIPKQ